MSRSLARFIELYKPSRMHHPIDDGAYQLVIFEHNAGLAVDAIALYTNLFFKASIGIAIAMAIISLIELIYVGVVNIIGNLITGWVTTMTVLPLGFLGLFVLLSFALKYLDLLVKTRFNKKSYFVELIEKV